MSHEADLAQRRDAAPNWPGQAGWRSRMGGIALALTMQGGLIVLLVLGLSPDMRRQVVSNAVAAFSLPDAAHPAPVVPREMAKTPVKAPAALSGAAGQRATPREIVAPIPLVEFTQSPAPQVAATGAANTSGLRDTGAGTGAGASGTGGGSGSGGTGQGGGGSALAQIAGTIDSARDYPRAGREARIGHAALIVFIVGVDGRAHDCHVRESSGDAQTDAITCRLAEERFRFRPATDAGGQPVERAYGWRQKWFY